MRGKFLYEEDEGVLKRTSYLIPENGAGGAGASEDGRKIN